MIVKFNPSGTHVHKGKLKVRVDIYPVPSSKTYPQQRVDKLNREYSKEEMAELDLLWNNERALEAKVAELRDIIGIHKATNPCLCHFIIIPKGITKNQLRKIIAVTFDKATIDGLDDALSKDDRGRVSQIMKMRCGVGADVGLIDFEDINTRFKDLEVIVGVD